MLLYNKGMARTSALSDAAVKLHCPEMFPLPNDQYRLFHPTTVEHHKLPGVKPERRFKDYTSFARFPDNDFRNFGNILAVNNRETASLRAILNYRNQIGSKNFPSNVTKEALDEFERIRTAEATGSARNIINLTQMAPSSGLAPPPVVPQTTSGAGSSTAASQALTGDPMGTASQLDFTISSRTRKEQIQAFKQFDVGQAGKFYTASAKAYMGAFPSDTRNQILAHFSSEIPMTQATKTKIDVNRVANYLMTQKPSPQERVQIQGLLNQAKQVSAQKQMGFPISPSRFLTGKTPVQVAEEIAEQQEDDE